MELSYEDLLEMEQALVEWKKIWLGVYKQRAEWVDCQSRDQKYIKFAEHNKEVMKTAKQHCNTTSELIRKVQKFKCDIIEYSNNPPKEIVVEGHITEWRRP